MGSLPYQWAKEQFVNQESGTYENIILTLHTERFNR